jgi:hypothetical protein
VEKYHGRIETRRWVVVDNREGLVDPKPWPGAKTLIKVESSRELNGIASRERRSYISSLKADAERLGEIVRGHWGIENRLHWSLDIAL